MSSNNWRRNTPKGDANGGDWKQKRNNRNRPKNNHPDQNDETEDVDKNKTRNNNRRNDNGRNGRRNDNDRRYRRDNNNQSSTTNGVYQPPSRRKEGGEQKVRPIEKDDFPSLTKTTNNSLSNTSSGPSWTSILAKKDESDKETNDSPNPMKVQKQVEDWTDRPKNNNPIGKVIDLSNHQSRIQQYRRPRFLPEVLKTELELEMEELREEDYWNNRYAGEVDDDDENSESEH